MKKNRKSIKAFCGNIKMLTQLVNGLSIAEFEQKVIDADVIIKDCLSLNITIVSFIDDEYPQALLQIKDSPPILYLKGNVALLNKVIAIVGTRHSTVLGNKIGNKLGEFFSENWAVCNSLVDGIDAHVVAHGEAVYPHVIGVLSGGLDFMSTSSKLTQDLANKVLLNEGLLVSESSPYKKEDQFSGSKASRIVAGLSHGLILVQSTFTGGSKHAIKTFSETKRPLGVVAFSGNEEYQKSDAFAANRLLLAEHVKAIQQICGIKKAENILTNTIMSISSKDDYLLLESEILASMGRRSFNHSNLS